MDRGHRADLRLLLVEVVKFKFPKISFGTALLILAALVNVPRWVGVYTFGSYVWLNGLSGFSMGLAMAAGLAFTFHRVGQMQPLTPKGRPVMRFWLGLLAGIIILGVSVYLLPPYILESMPPEFKQQLTNPSLWSTLSVVAADLLVVMISAIDSKAAGWTQTRQPATPAGRQGGRSGKVAGGKGKRQGGKSASRQVATGRQVVTDQQLAAYLAANPTASIRAVAKHFGVSHQALGPRINAMKGKQP